MESAERPSVAVIGSGAAGLGAAWLLARGRYDVHLYESAARPGGHANTVDIRIPSSSPSAYIPVDTGFIVYNTRTYPDIVSLFQLMGVDEENSSMSFSSSVCLPSGHLLEWGSDTLDSLFADRSNLHRPAMYTMLYDVRRFNNAVYDFVHASEDPSYKDRDITLSQFLEQGAYSTVFIQAYLVPMVSAVWSASYTSALQFPALSLFHFFVNHGLAQIFSRPQWRTPAKRSRDYVSRILTDFRAHGGTFHLSAPVTRIERHPDHVIVYADACEPRRFDHVVFATHPPDTLDILSHSATEDERRVLSAFLYSKNKAYVHHDSNLMPKNRKVWSSWNFIGPRSTLVQTPLLSRPPNLSPTSSSMSSEVPNSACKPSASQPSLNITPPAAPDHEASKTDPPNSKAYAEATDSIVRPSSSSSENECTAPSVISEDSPVCVSYWLNRLQNYHKFHLPVPDLFITLNPITKIDPRKILLELSYDHPQFNEAAIQAQSQVKSLLQGKNRTWFCGAWTRFGFHEDALMSGLDIAEQLSNYAIKRPWRARNHLAINDNSRIYSLPCSPLRAPVFIYITALIVINMVLNGLQAGLGKIAARMSDQDPVVLVADGDGKLYRFGPSRSRRRTSSSFAFARISELSSSLDVSEPSAARLSVRNPKILVRITDALRKGSQLAPTAAAAFAASELDCPSPSDLSESLRALFIADALDNPSRARPGRAKLAENLLYVLVGNFEQVSSMPMHTHLPELTTCTTTVIAPPWWLEIDDDANDVPQDFSESSRIVSRVSPKDLRNSKNVLELIGDLSELTVALLQANSSCHATVITHTTERMNFVNRKADLLLVRDQVSVTLLDRFKEQVNSGLGVSHDLEQDEALYDLILSPAILNSYANCGFESLQDIMKFLRVVAKPNAAVELGVTIYGKRPTILRDNPDRLRNRIFCGDEGFEFWSANEVVRAIYAEGFELEQVCMMDQEEAALDVHEVVQRVYNSLATEKLEPSETRRVLAQMCLWQAALSVKYIRRMAVSLTLN